MVQNKNLIERYRHTFMKNEKKGRDSERKMKNKREIERERENERN